MCGIAGFSGNFDKILLGKMNALIAHRGPDDAGEIFFANAQVGLAHRRLSIIDVSTVGHQPMTVHCGVCKPHLWLTYNGELYNYRDLRRDLIAKGHTFHSQTDSEVLLHLYTEYGIKMLKHLNGMFAFALFDGDALFIARDGLGIKPLYYAELNRSHEKGFLFASELKALLACKSISREIDYTAIHYYLAYLWCPGQQTALKTIRKLEPGEALIVHQGKIKKRWFFYDLPYGGSNHFADLNHQSLRELCDELNTRLEVSVKRQLMADVPLGAFLSGGLDSSAIVAMMRKLNPDTRFHCYTIAFDETMESEGNPNDLPYARDVAKHLNVDLKVLTPKADMIHHLEHMIYHLDEPEADPAPLHVYFIAKAAKEDGIKVLLSGCGGDDIFSGYRRHRALQANRILRFLPGRLRLTLANFAKNILAGGARHLNMQKPWVRRSAKLFSALHLPMDQQIIHHFLWSTEGLRLSLLSENMRSELGDHHHSMQPLLKSLARIPKEEKLLNRMLYLEAKHFLADHNLNYTDKMSMATGVEVRVPLLDLELIQFATRIPPHLKQHGKVGKFIFKKAMEESLPKNIIYRPKAGFGAPLRRWLHQELRPMVEDILSPKSIAARGLFDEKAVAKLIAYDRAHRLDASYTIFSLLAIELWCRKFVDGTSP